LIVEPLAALAPALPASRRARHHLSSCVDGNESFDTSVISKSAHIIRVFIDDYHERNEEQFVFPRFKQAGKLTDLVNVLYQQHQALAVV
jgi:hypothetical protein